MTPRLPAVPHDGFSFRRRSLVVGGLALVLRPARGSAAAPIRLARIEAVPDQRVGSEVLKAVYDAIDVPVEFVDVPAKRALVESSSGRLDGEVQRVLDVAREYPTLLPVREPIMFIEPTAFSRRDDLSIHGWESLRPYAVGIVRGVGSSERGTQGLPRVEAVTTMEQMMQMAAGGRIDVAVNDRFSGLVILKRLGLDAQVKPVQPALQHIDLYHFVHERHRELVPQLEAAVRRLRANGELERVREQSMQRLLAEAGQ